MSDQITITIDREVAERLAWNCESLRALDDASRDLAAALSQIPEAKSHDYPLFDIDRALATIKRLKSAHHPNSRAVADKHNLSPSVLTGEYFTLNAPIIAIGARGFDWGES